MAESGFVEPQEWFRRSLFDALLGASRSPDASAAQALSWIEQARALYQREFDSKAPALLAWAQTLARNHQHEAAISVLERTEGLPESDPAAVRALQVWSLLACARYQGLWGDKAVGALQAAQVLLSTTPEERAQESDTSRAVWRRQVLELAALGEEYQGLLSSLGDMHGPAEEALFAATQPRRGPTLVETFQAGLSEYRGDPFLGANLLEALRNCIPNAAPPFPAELRLFVDLHSDHPWAQLVEASFVAESDIEAALPLLDRALEGRSAFVAALLLRARIRVARWRATASPDELLAARADLLALRKLNPGYPPAARLAESLPPE